MTWEIKRLDEVAEVRLGRQRSPSNHSGTHMVPYLRAANVGWGGLLLNDVKEMNFTESEMLTYRLRVGDVLLAEASGSPGEVGKPALWNGELQDCAFQNTLLRVRSNQHDPRFLLHYFRHVALDGRFVAESRGVGINHLGRARLAAWPTPIPPLADQRRIVDLIEEHLSHLDAADASLRRAHDLARTALAAGFWQLTHTGATPTRMEAVGEVRLGRQRSPKNHSGNRMRPYLRAANVDWDRLRLADVKEMNFTEDEEEIYSLRSGDILLTEASGSPAEVGKSVVYRGEAGRVCFQNTLLRIRCTEAEPDFIQKYLLAEAMIGRFMPESRGVGINHLGRARLAAFEIELPTRDLQRQIAASCEELRENLRRLQVSVSTLEERQGMLRRAVLAAAFSGRLTGHPSDAERVEELAAREPND